MRYIFVQANYSPFFASLHCAAMRHSCIHRMGKRNHISKCKCWIPSQL